VSAKKEKITKLVDIIHDESIKSKKEKTCLCEQVIPTINDTILKSIQEETVDPALETITVDQSVTKFITDTIHTTIGQQQEDKSINRYEQDNQVRVIDRNKRTYKKTMSDFIVYGKVDGIQEDDQIIEHKQRMNRLFGRIVEREKIQLYVYMYLTGITKATLVETYRSSQQSYSLEFEQDTWRMYKQSLTEAIHELRNILASSDRKRTLLTKTNEPINSSSCKLV